MGGFAAANSFLHGLTRHQSNRDGLQSYCFSWSMWDSLGISSGYQKKDLFRSRGYHVMSPVQGLSSFIVGLCHNQNELIIGLDGNNRHIRRKAESSFSNAQKLSAYIVLSDASISQDSLSPVAVFDRFGNRSRCDLKIVSNEAITENGEIDRRRLVAPRRIAKREPIESVSPRNAIEEGIARIWQEVLGAWHVSVFDNFFDLGGDSITATQFISRVNQVFRVDLPQLSLYESPTIADLARFVEAIEEIKQAALPHYSQP